MTEWPTVTVKDLDQAMTTVSLWADNGHLDAGTYALVPVDSLGKKVWWCEFVAGSAGTCEPAYPCHDGCGWKQLVDLPEGSGE